MKNWFRRMGERIARMMQGRYGEDALNRVLLIAAMALLILSFIPYLQICLLLSAALMGYSMFRCYSRNIPKRQRELYAWLRFWNGLRARLGLQKKKWKERKTHCYFHCGKCKAVLRVPRGKGMIDVTCPKCGHITVKKT